MATDVLPQPPSERRPYRERYAAAPRNWLAVAMGLTFHAIALSALTQPFHWRYIPLMAFVYGWGMLSTTLYLHRTLTHRGLTLARPLCWFFALGTSTNLLADPVGWVGTHRHHHGASDTDDDVHTPLDGFYFAHFGWATRLTPEMNRELRALAPDVRRDPFCRWLEHPACYGGCHLALAGGVYAAFGLGGLLWGFYVPVLLSIHFTAAVNSVCHMPRFGYRRFETRDRSRNVAWLALPTFGESFHNNHHAHPRRARHGLRWSEPDPTSGAIWILERLRLAKDVAWGQPPSQGESAGPQAGIN